MHMWSNRTYKYYDEKYSDSGIMKSGYTEILNLNSTMNLYDGEYVVYNSDSFVKASGKYVSSLKDTDKYAEYIFHITDDALREEHPYCAAIPHLC